MTNDEARMTNDETAMTWHQGGAADLVWSFWLGHSSFPNAAGSPIGSMSR